MTNQIEIDVPDYLRDEMMFLYGQLEALKWYGADRTLPSFEFLQEVSERYHKILKVMWECEDV